MIGVRHRRGHTLLEVIVALAILAIVGAASASLAIDIGQTVNRAQATGAILTDVSAFLDAVALWTRDDLDRHLGTRVQGSWRMTVSRPFPTLYEVEMRDSSGKRVLLSTVLYRDTHSRRTENVGN